MNRIYFRDSPENIVMVGAIAVAFVAGVSGCHLLNLEHTTRNIRKREGVVKVLTPRYKTMLRTRCIFPDIIGLTEDFGPKLKCQIKAPKSSQWRS